MTQSYHHILFATDLEPGSSEACQQAQQFAAVFQARLSVLHVMPEVVSNYLIASEGFRDQLLEEAKTEFKQLQQAVGLEDDQCYLIEGLPKEEILQFADSETVDLIILNGRKHNWIGVLGSTASAVVNKAECHVMILRDNDKTA